MPLPATTRRTIAVIDGNSLMHRAFHSTPPTLTAANGQPTNAVFGFFNMFVKMVETFQPDGVIVAFDRGKPQVRMDMLPQYKAQRPPMDPSLRSQFPVVKELLRILDVPVAELEGWEGDDILGTLARRGEEAGYHMYLITGDRDMYQLSTEHVSIVATRKGMSDIAIMTPETVEDLYHGITPELVPDFYGLKGDSSDNIPGVPGIGPKKAADLLTTYGTLDNVIAHADEVKGKMGENLRAHIEDALVSRKVATIFTNAPLELSLEDATWPTFDPTVVTEAFRTYSLNTAARRLCKVAGHTLPQDAAATQVPTPSVAEGLNFTTVLRGAEALEALQALIANGGRVAAEYQETVYKPRKPLEMRSRGLWVATADKLLCVMGDAIATYVGYLLKNNQIVSFNLKALAHQALPYDSAQPATVELRDIRPARLFDCGVADYLLNSDETDHRGPACYERLGGTSMIPEATEQLPEAALDARIAFEVYEVLKAKLEETASLAVSEKIEMPLLPVLLQMERTGLQADSEVFRQQADDLALEIAQQVSAIKTEAGEDFNLDSPAQLSHILFDVLKLPTDGLKKTKKGFYSTNAKILEEFAVDYPLVRNVLEYRERTKIISTYLDALPSDIRTDGRIHTTLNQTVAATGRLSSSDPNLQNIPTRSELGHRVRSAFTVPEGHVFMACDYSQIELRLLAHLSGDEHLIVAFNQGEDFHAQTASRVFGVPVEEVTPLLRSRAKAVNFGIVYGQQAFGLSQSLQIPRAEAQAMIDRYFEAYPQVQAYLKGTINEAYQLGYATTMYGRRRYIKEFKQANAMLRAYGERTAMNHPVQGSAADIIKLAMVAVQKRLQEAQLATKMVLQIHDELDFEVPLAELEQVSALVKETMEGVAELSVPLIAEPSYGANWAEAK